VVLMLVLIHVLDTCVKQVQSITWQAIRALLRAVMPEFSCSLAWGWVISARPSRSVIPVSREVIPVVGATIPDMPSRIQEFGLARH
jgi:hypothetical protein